MAVVAIIASGLVNARLRRFFGGSASANAVHLFRVKLAIATALILTFLFALPLLKRIKQPKLRGRLFTAVHILVLALGVVAAALGILIAG